MKLLVCHTNKPFFNLATEEYLLNQSENYLLIYINESSVIIGKHQNPWTEVNVEHCLGNNIPILRRLTGGGAVYHDAGNINFSFILRKDTDFIDFREHIEPIRKVLNDLEIPCYITDRNDLFIDSKKISGNAEHVSNSSGRLIHHGTLLFNAQLNQLRQSLHTENPLIETHAVKSVRSSVANISEFRGDLSIQEFRKELIMRISRELAIGEIVDFYAEQNPDIIALSDGKYSHWDWIFGKSPQFTFQSNIGTITVRDGHIKAVDLPVEYSYLKASLSGLRYHRQHMLDKGIDKTIVNLICLPS